MPGVYWRPGQASILSATLVRNNFTHSVIVHLVRRAVESQTGGRKNVRHVKVRDTKFSVLRGKGKLFSEIGILRATRGVTVDIVVPNEQLLFSPFSCIYIYYATSTLLKSIKSLLIEFRV